MSMSKLVAMLGSAASGYNAGLNAKEERDDRARKRQQDQEDRDFNMAERARAKKMRDDMGAAAAPVAVEQVQPAGPVMEGAPGAAGQVIPQVSMVQGRSFATPGEAATAATAANTPQAVTGRMADVAMRNGDPAKAQQLRVGSMQEQTGQYQLNAAMRADLDAKFNDDLQKNVTDWASFDRFTSDSAGDGMGGAVKLKTLPSADGKSMVVNVIGPDGVPTPTGKVFPNTADGLALATAELARMPAEKKLAHLHQKAMLARQAKNDEEAARHNKELERLSGDKTAAQIEIATMRGEVARAKAAGAAQPQGMTLADLKDGHKGIATTLNADWKTQIDAETDPAKLKAIKVARENEIATVQRLYTGAMSAGFGLTPEQAIVAFRSGEAGTQAFTTKDGKTVSVQGVQYGGRFIPLADNPGAAMAPKPAAAPGAKPAAGSAATPATPVAEPAKPGMVDRIVGAAKGALADGAETGRQMEAIRARVLEAGKGGAPLTTAERAQAKKYGMTPTS